MPTDFPSWFERQTGFAPHAWQRQLGEANDYRSRLIRIPTGMGKTLGVLAAWSYHRLVRDDATWPRRLIWCLPTRTLVEQTADVARAWLEALERCASPSGIPTVLVHVGLSRKCT